jgi:hypothetical protein
VTLYSLALCESGNAVQTVKSNDTVKLLTVRGTAFEPAATSGGSAAVEPGLFTVCFHFSNSVIMDAVVACLGIVRLCNCKTKLHEMSNFSTNYLQTLCSLLPLST